MERNVKRVCELGGKDRISSLPDAILEHILSFLPTKIAVSTSVLSSRWTPVWTFVPVINFNDYTYCVSHPREFMNILDRVLLLRNRCSNIHKFSLDCYTIDDISRLNSWITAIFNSKIHHLNLQICEYDDNPLFVFPRCLFMPESLSTLTTLNINMRCTLKIPCYIQFVKLKVLELTYVQLSGNFLTDQPVLFDFPNLQYFMLEHFQVVGTTTISISAPRLETLCINDCYDSGDSQFNCQIKVYAESLISLSFQSSLSIDYSFYGLSSLVQAEVCFYNETVLPTKILRAISNVKDLIVDNTAKLSAALALHQADHFSHPLTLSSVIKLTIDEECGQLNFRDLMRLLHILPNLESLLIDYSRCIYVEEDCTLTSIPKCFVSHLKSIKFISFRGYANELHAISFLLKNVQVLERMTFKRLHDEKKQVEVTKQLLLVPKGSTQCIIAFD